MHNFTFTFLNQFKNILFILLIPVGILQAQYYKAEIDTRLSVSKMKDRAKHAMESGDMYTALFYYEEIVNKDTSNLDNRFELAELYRQSRNYKMAEKTYRGVYDRDPVKYPYSLYFMALMQKMTGNYETAKSNYLKFKKEVGNISDKSFKQLLNREIAGCDSGIVYQEFEDNIKLYNVGKSVNNPHAEFSPVLIDSTTLLFGSLRMDSIRYFDSRDEHFEQVPTRQIYIAKKNPDSTWTEKGHFATLNHPEAQMGNFVFSPNTNRYYFTKCSKEVHHKVTCKIYYTEKKDGKWSHPILLPHPVNMPGHTSTQPAIVYDTASFTATVAPVGRPPARNNSRPPSKNNASPPTPVKKDGPKTEYLYFVSDRSGGKGGLDIWYTYYNTARKIWAEPVNVSAINTPEMECTPFFHVPTQTLYFSSNGHVSAGGLDIYKTKRDSTRRFAPPQNLAFPVNSPQDELGFTIVDNTKFGMLVSNRPGGTPFFHETCCDDIFAFDVLPEKQFKCILNLDVLKPDTLPCANRILNVRKYDLKTKKESYDTIRLADCNYKVSLEKNYQYSVSVNVDGFEKDTLHIETRNVSTSDTLHKNLVLKPIEKVKKIDITPVEGKPFVLKDIQYEFNSAELTALGKQTIDTLLIPFLLEHPNDKVQISSHTDNQGSHNYNMALSKQRASKVAEYLVSKGIAKERIEHKGLGETKHIAPNENPDGSDNPIGRSFNRRTEFLIIKPN